MAQNPSSTQQNYARPGRKKPQSGAYTLGYMSGYYLTKLCQCSISPDKGREALHKGFEVLRDAASKEPSIHADFLKGLDGALADWTGDYML